MKKNSIFLIIIFIILSITTSYRLFRPGYFSMQDDMQIFRLQQFDKCIKDIQIPCRYIPDGGLGYGYPLFNYYSPLPYALAEKLHLVGFSYINSIKSVFIIGFIAGTVGIFLFTSIFWGIEGALISTILFTYAPYRSVDSFVRGSIAEFLALNLFPWIFWAITKLIKTKKYPYFLVSVFFLSMLFLSHNLMSIAILPVLVGYILIISYKDIKTLLHVFLVGLFSFGLASFFLLPALFEKNLVTVNSMTQGYFYYVAHFATLKQLFLNHNDWGYGASLWGPKDDMSFQIGYIQWILPVFVVISSFFYKKITQRITIYFFFLSFLFYTFLTHSKSTFIWQLLPFMAFFQFPWRFLAVVIFVLSFISGAAILFIKNNKIKYITVAAIFLATFLLNFSFFKEDIWYPNLTDSQKLTAPEITRQSGAGIRDYWPKTGNDFPKSYAPGSPQIDSNSKATILSYSKSSQLITADINVSSQSAAITFPVVYFPKWRLLVDNKIANYSTTPDLGLIQVTLSSGLHHIQLSFYNTTLRTFANYLSLITFLAMLLYSIFFYYRQNYVHKK